MHLSIVQGLVIVAQAHVCASGITQYSYYAMQIELKLEIGAIQVFNLLNNRGKMYVSH